MCPINNGKIYQCNFFISSRIGLLLLLLFVSVIILSILIVTFIVF